MIPDRYEQNSRLEDKISDHELFLCNLTQALNELIYSERQVNETELCSKYNINSQELCNCISELSQRSFLTENQINKVLKMLNIKLNTPPPKPPNKVQRKGSNTNPSIFFKDQPKFTAKPETGKIIKAPPSTEGNERKKSSFEPFLDGNDFHNKAQKNSNNHVKTKLLNFMKNHLGIEYDIEYLSKRLKIDYETIKVSLSRLATMRKIRRVDRGIYVFTVGNNQSNNQSNKIRTEKVTRPPRGWTRERAQVGNKKEQEKVTTKVTTKVTETNEKPPLMPDTSFVPKKVWDNGSKGRD